LQFLLPLSWYPCQGDARIQGDLSQVRTLALLVEDDEGSYASTCASATSLGAAGTNYATQLGVIQDDLEDQDSSVECYADADDYCIHAELLSNDDEWYCIDSNGGATVVDDNATCSAAGTGCTH